MAGPQTLPAQVPNMASPIADASGDCTQTWYWFFQVLWRRTGGGAGPGQIAGGPAQPQTLVASPFEFIASGYGTLVVFGAEVDLSRDNGTTWYKVTLQGGAIPVLANDVVRVIWYGATPPPVTFFPTYFSIGT